MTTPPPRSPVAIADPIAQLRRDREQALASGDAHATLCAVATIDVDGCPDLRTLVLRDVDVADQQRFAVFINATSPKFETMRAHPIAVLIYLPTQQVQYRMRCTTSEVPANVIRASWPLRPETPKHLDWFYERVARQSTPVASREVLLGGLADLDLPEPLTVPPSARGLFLDPRRVERLDLSLAPEVHDRRRFERTDTGWTEVVLVP